ncbi:MAG: polymer-forming cytoskeletal protein [bacterium]
MGLLRRRDSNISANSGQVVTLIGAEAYFQGTFTAKGSLKVDGRIEGSVVDAQTVVIGETGRIIGDISGETILVGGEIRGNITGAQHVELLSKCKVQGDIRTPKILIEEGATFDGHCSMTVSPTDEPRVKKLAAQEGPK